MVVKSEVQILKKAPFMIQLNLFASKKRNTSMYHMNRLDYCLRSLYFLFVASKHCEMWFALCCCAKADCEVDRQ